eukprot:scaffold253910_cov30-Tisochrysis_lutea.AAC.1
MGRKYFLRPGGESSTSARLTQTGLQRPGRLLAWLSSLEVARFAVMPPRRKPEISPCDPSFITSLPGEMVRSAMLSGTQLTAEMFPTTSCSAECEAYSGGARWIYSVFGGSRVGLSNFGESWCGGTAGRGACSCLARRTYSMSGGSMGGGRGGSACGRVNGGGWLFASSRSFNRVCGTFDALMSLDKP